MWFPICLLLLLHISGLLGTQCLLMDGSRSEIAFANCNSLEACQNALSEDFIPKTRALWGKIKQYTALLAKND